MSSNIIGWRDQPQDDPEVVRLREHLAHNNGIPDLEIVKPGDIEKAVKLFQRDGFVVVEDMLNQDQIDIVQAGCDEVIDEILALDEGRQGNRGSHRYSFGGSSMTRSQLHRPTWQMMLCHEPMLDLVDAIFGSPNYMLRAASGDFCLPGAVNYQPLHSDVGTWINNKISRFSSFSDPRDFVKVGDLPTPYIAVNFLPQEITRLNGPTRQIPGTHTSRAHIPSLDQEPEWMRLSTVCPAPAGAIMLRDVRAWHGGTPNVSEGIRSIPNLEFYAPWFREPIVPGITYQDFKKLPERAQDKVRFSVLDSSEVLDTRTVMRAP